MSLIHDLGEGFKKLMIQKVLGTILLITVQRVIIIAKILNTEETLY